MRKILALSVAAIVMISAVSFAVPSGGDRSGDKPGKTVTGTVSRVDAAAKMMVVKDTSGNEVTVYWNEATKLDGGVPQEGATVTVNAREEGGRTLATSIQSQSARKPSY